MFKQKPTMNGSPDLPRANGRETRARRKKSRVLIGCGLVLALLVFLAWYGIHSLTKPRPEVFRSEVAQRGEVAIKVVETGTIEPLRKVEVKSKVGGRVSRLRVDEGMLVKRGQVLAEIDPQEINSQVAALRSQLAGAEARLAAARKTAIYQQQQTSASISQYIHNVESARSKMQQAEAEAGAQPGLTQQTIQIAEANLDAAKAALQAQRSSLSLLIQSTHPQALVSAQSGYDQGFAQLKNDQMSEQRQQQLFAQGYVAAQDVDSAHMQAALSRSHLREVKERMDRIKRTMDLEEANTRAQIAGAEGQVRQMEAALAQAKASILPATTQRAVDSARAAYAEAQAQLAAARAGRTQDLVRGDEAAAAEAEVRQIQNQVNEKLVNQGDTTLVASMAGMITRRYVEQGELITSAIGSFSSGTPLFQIADLSTMLVRINVNEVDIARVKPGMLAEVTIDAERGINFAGLVRRVAPAAQSGSTGSTDSNSSTQSVIRFPVEVQIDHADSRLKPGMSARCAIIVARRKGVVRVPTNCVYGTGAGASVKVVTINSKGDHNTEVVTSRPVTVGLRGDNYIEIVSGLKEGEKVRPAPYSGPKRKDLSVGIGPD